MNAARPCAEAAVSVRHGKHYIKRRVPCFVEIAASRFRAPRNDRVFISLQV
ncbi:MAG: hypothetical protein LBL66_08565 [Clostridiales bacterium]|nr:hypothetical protein [Clostridiales bacterium]